MTGLGVDGMLVSPGYHYESVERDIFLTQAEIQRKFERVLELSKKYRLTLDADVPGVRGRQARLRLLALEHGDLHARTAGRRPAT